MNVEPKVIAAISSAVGYYMQAEQEALLAAQAQRRPAQPVAATRPFSIAGRQAAMDVRWAWQMRLPR
jgi:hypothetical protein